MRLRLLASVTIYVFAFFPAKHSTLSYSSSSTSLLIFIQRAISGCLYVRYYNVWSLTTKALNLTYYFSQDILMRNGKTRAPFFLKILFLFFFLLRYCLSEIWRFYGRIICGPHLYNYPKANAYRASYVLYGI